MNTVIILSIFVSSFFIEKLIDKLALSVFCFAVLSFNIAGHYIPNEYGQLYYLLAAIVDLSLIIILSKMSAITSLITKIQQVCKAFIAVNFIGWALFMLYYEPILYEIMCGVLYAYLLTLTLASKERGDVGYFTMDRWSPGFLLNLYKSYRFVQGGKTEKRA